MTNALILSLCLWAIFASALAQSWALAGLSAVLLVTQLRLSMEVR